MLTNATLDANVSRCVVSGEFVYLLVGRAGIWTRSLGGSIIGIWWKDTRLIRHWPTGFVLYFVMFD